MLERLAETTDSPEIRAEVVGVLAGEWFADPDPALSSSAHRGRAAADQRRS